MANHPPTDLEDRERRRAQAAELASLRSQVEWSPHDWRLRIALGDALTAAGREEEAVGLYLAAHRIDPGDGASAVKMGRFYLSRSLWDPALFWLRKAIELDVPDAAAMASTALAEARSGNHDQAVALLDGWVAAAPESPMRRHIAMSLLGEETPAVAPPEYVRGLFNHYASRFDEGLRKLGYCGPELIAEAIAGCSDAPWPDGAALDVGCGTGLVGLAIRASVGRLEGVDLSPTMLEKAAERSIYDRLHEDEMIAVMRSRPDDFSVITASDVLTYVGELESFALAAQTALAPGGWVFVVFEHSDSPGEGLGYRLQESGRFAHDSGYVRRCFEAAGFDARVVSERSMRSEHGVPAPSLTVAARLATGA